jgi:transposase InsO family protein
MAICDEFEAYGYRRVGAELRHQGVVVNSKRLRRFMREHNLQPRRRRRYAITADSNHDSPIFPNLAKDKVVNGPCRATSETDPPCCLTTECYPRSRVVAPRTDLPSLALLPRPPPSRPALAEPRAG